MLNNRRTNQIEIGFPTRDSNFDDSEERAEHCPLHHGHWFLQLKSNKNALNAFRNTQNGINAKVLTKRK